MFAFESRLIINHEWTRMNTNLKTKCLAAGPEAAKGSALWLMAYSLCIKPLAISNKP